MGNAKASIEIQKASVSCGKCKCSGSAKASILMVPLLLKYRKLVFGSTIISAMGNASVLTD